MSSDRSYAGPERRGHGARFALPAPLPAWWPLTRAETRVAELLAAGHSQQEAATRLGCAYLTVGTHLKHIGMRLPGQGTPTDRLRALAVRCALYAAAHPGTVLPETLFRRELAA